MRAAFKHLDFMAPLIGVIDAFCLQRETLSSLSTFSYQVLLEVSVVKGGENLSSSRWGNHHSSYRPNYLLLLSSFISSDHMHSSLSS